MKIAFGALTKDKINEKGLLLNREYIIDNDYFMSTLNYSSEIKFEDLTKENLEEFYKDMALYISFEFVKRFINKGK